MISAGILVGRREINLHMLRNGPRLEIVGPTIPSGVTPGRRSTL